MDPCVSRARQRRPVEWVDGSTSWGRTERRLHLIGGVVRYVETSGAIVQAAGPDGACIAIRGHTTGAAGGPMLKLAPGRVLKRGIE